MYRKWWRGDAQVINGTSTVSPSLFEPAAFSGSQFPLVALLHNMQLLLEGDKGIPSLAWGRCLAPGWVSLAGKRCSHADPLLSWLTASAQSFSEFRWLGGIA